MWKAFISSDRDHPLFCARLPAGLFRSGFLRKEKFPIKQKKRMVYNLLFHTPLRCYFDIKLLVMLTALIGLPILLLYQEIILYNQLYLPVTFYLL